MDAEKAHLTKKIKGAAAKPKPKPKPKARKLATMPKARKIRKPNP